jgi:hypothetical protein
MARQALDGCGWEWRGLTFTHPWEVGTGTYLGEVNGKHIVNYGSTLTPNIVSWDAALICGFSAVISKTWDQGVLNSYVLDVKSQASIDLIGERAVAETWVQQEDPTVDEPADQSGAAPTLSSTSTTQAGVTAINTSAGSPSTPQLVQGVELSNGDWRYDQSDIADVLVLLLTALARARTEILSRARAHTERFDVPFSHAHRLANTVRVIGDVTCKGKTRSLVHVIDPDAGTATTTLGLAISGLENQDVDTPVPLEDPETTDGDPLTTYTDLVLQTHIGGEFSSPPKPLTPNAFFTDYTYAGQTPSDPDYVSRATVEVYGTGFRITAPDIGPADVDDIEQSFSAPVVLNVPVDEYVVAYDGECG